MTEKTKRAPRLNQRWSKADDAILTEMAKKNKRTSDIAQVLGRTRASVWSRKCLLGLGDHRLSQSRGTDVPASLSTKQRSGSGRGKYSKTFINTVVSDRKRTGATYRVLSERYGVPFQVIASWMKKVRAPKDENQMSIPFPKEDSMSKVLRVGQEEIIQKAAAIAKANGMKLTVLHFE